jgi:threonine synthase
MMYRSTRGGAAEVDFVEASLIGLAADGGLFTPVSYPQLDRARADHSYVDTAVRILSAFAGNALPESVVRAICERAYAPFSHASVAPLVEVGPGRWMLELHHGPTLAFKDVAMRLIAQLYDHVLARRGERMTILCATSGDTGGAAASAFAGAEQVDIVILHPRGRISPTQRLFMTATGADNVHNLALEGDFDGTQAILKELLADAAFRQRTSLAAVNSINWTRVAAQSVYFAQAQAQLGATTPIRFVVPTGNFGDALAAHVASRCGLLNGFECIAAVNANDAMARLFDGEPLSRGLTHPTLSPAMDIQLPSNFERLLFEALRGDGASVARAYSGLASEGCGPLPAAAAGAFRAMGFSALRVDDDATLDEMRRTHAETGWMVCPHTAVGLAAARRSGPAGGAVVTLATAHAAKFPETVEAALGVRPALPDRVGDLLARPERFDTGPMSSAFVRDRIEAVVRSRS